VYRENKFFFSFSGKRSDFLLRYNALILNFCFSKNLQIKEIRKLRSKFFFHCFWFILLFRILQLIKLELERSKKETISDVLGPCLNENLKQVYLFIFAANLNNSTFIGCKDNLLFKKLKLTVQF